MRRFFVIFIPVVILALSILLMLSSPYLKKPRGAGDDVVKCMDKVTSAVTSNNWPLAKQSTGELETAWKIVLNRIQFSSERDEINSLNVSLARLKAAITSKDRTSSLMEISEALQHWNDLGK